MRFRAIKERLRVWRAERDVWNRRVTLRPHGLDAPLFISLTSYPGRFNVLHNTLAALLRQSTQPDGVILWLGEADVAAVPDAVRALCSEGLEIRSAEDMRSFTKIVPMLKERPDAYIVTADDDQFYPVSWLEDMVALARSHPGQVIAHRAHRITYNPDGSMCSYEDWSKNVGGVGAGADIFATGVGGVLYPPGSLHPDVIRDDLFRALCPNADDVWLYWMERRNGTLVRHVGPRTRIIEWKGSQIKNLRSINRGQPGLCGNDKAIAAMTAYFGRP